MALCKWFLLLKQTPPHQKNTDFRVFNFFPMKKDIADAYGESFLLLQNKTIYSQDVN